MKAATRIGGIAGVSVSRGDLEGLDVARSEALALFCFSDVRPLAGVAAFVDWRVCGAISRRLESGNFRGELGEAVLLPTSGRLGRQRLFLFGLGPKEECEQQVLAMACQEAYQVMHCAGVTSIVMAAPADHVSDYELPFVRAVASALPSKVERVLVEALSSSG